MTAAHTRRITHRAAVALGPLLAVALAACGGGTFAEHNPIAPTPVTTSRVALTGTITDQANAAPLADATVTILDGPNALRVATSDDKGVFQFADMARGGFNIRATHAGYEESVQGVNLGDDLKIAVSLARAPLALGGTFRGTFAQTVNGSAGAAIPISTATITQTGLSFSGSFTAVSGLTGTFSGTLSSDVAGALVSGVTKLRNPNPGSTTVCTGSGGFTGTTTALGLTMTTPLLVLDNCTGAVTNIMVSLTRVTTSAAIRVR